VSTILYLVNHEGESVYEFTIPLRAMGFTGPDIVAYIGSLGVAVPQNCAKFGHVPQVYDYYPSMAPLYFQF